MRRNVTTRLARTRAEARDYRSTKLLEGFQIHCLAHAFAAVSTKEGNGAEPHLLRSTSYQTPTRRGSPLPRRGGEKARPQLVMRTLFEGEPGFSILFSFDGRA